MPWLVSEEILERTVCLEVPFNRHGIDPFGISRVEVARMMTVLAWMYRRYFSVTVRGIEHVPARGRAMVVGNHSGGWAVDAMMVIASLFLDRDPPRLAHGMAEKFMSRVPFASLYTSRTGNFTGVPENAVKLLDSERLLMIFPEGARGTAKLYGDRNSLVRFGTGFMRLALQTRTPIVPFAFLGGGEAVPTVVNLYKLGKLVGMPYIPLTPYLLPLPRPVALELYYSEPMRFEGTGNEEDHVIFEYVEQVKARIAGLIDEGQRIRAQAGSGR
jgi:1-acyl-sn-glycerol-3-phosphate acyltransferase